jgi:hypothetical protein
MMGCNKYTTTFNVKNLNIYLFLYSLNICLNRVSFTERRKLNKKEFKTYTLKFIIDRLLLSLSLVFFEFVH